MQILAVQSVGARGLGTVTASVSDDAPAVSRATVATLDRENSTSTPRTLVAEAVVFPRDGKPLDRRPVQLRQQRADARYREDGHAGPNHDAPR